MQKLEHIHSITLRNQIAKRQYVRELLSSLMPGKTVTLAIKRPKGYKAVTGTVETVYEDKFTYRDSKGRMHMATKGDLMSMDVICKGRDK